MPMLPLRTLAPMLALPLALAAAPAAQDDDYTARVTAALADHVWEFDPDTFLGAGADWLIERAGAAQFTCLGESHGNVQTPRLTTQLLDALGEYGYGAYATETGPVSARILTGVLQGGGVEAGVGFMQANPFSIAFMNWREEIEAVKAALDAGYAVWGLDQEFAGSGRHLLKELDGLAKNDAAHALVARWHERATEGFLHFVKTRDSSRSFLSTVTPDDFDEFERAFEDAGPLAAEIIDELRATARVYGHYHAKRYYENNFDRIELMKRHFADRLAEQGAERRKVLMRFGSVHMGRGYSPLDQLDLGNHAAERAVARGGDSLHVYVFARGSRREDGTLVDFAEGSPWLLPLFAALPDADAVAIDLRPLRPLATARRVRDAMPELHDLVFRYDAAVIYSAFDPSTEIGPRPPR